LDIYASYAPGELTHSASGEMQVALLTLPNTAEFIVSQNGTRPASQGHHGLVI
jgi:hypothetical protein